MLFHGIKFTPIAINLQLRHKYSLQIGLLEKKKYVQRSPRAKNMWPGFI
jgi:hypothetical protein